MTAVFCHATSVDSVKVLHSAGVDGIILQLYPMSLRFISMKVAAEVGKYLNENGYSGLKIGAFTNEKDFIIEKLAKDSGINCFQFDGEEDVEFCQKYAGKYYKSFQLSPEFDVKGMLAYPIELVHLKFYKPEVYGGDGPTYYFDGARALSKHRKVILSGCITEPIAQRIVDEVKPYAVILDDELDADENKVIDPAKLERYLKIFKG